MYNRMFNQAGLFSINDEEKSFEENFFENLHNFCDKLKESDRKDLLNDLQEKFPNSTAFDAFKEQQEFKSDIRAILAKYKSKLPKKMKKVPVSDDEEL